MMTQAARLLVARLEDALDGAPGAVAVSVQRGRAWLLVLVQAASDAAMRTLGVELGTGPIEEVSALGQRWLRAEVRHGDTTITLTGPHLPAAGGKP